MAGTKAGVLKRRQTMIDKFNGDEQAYLEHQKEIGRRGGQVRRPETRRFYVDREAARAAGKLAAAKRHKLRTA